MRCGFLFSKSGMLFVIIGLWFFCGLFFRFYNFGLEKFKCQTYRSHVRPCGLRGLCGLRGMLLSHTHFFGNLKSSEMSEFNKMILFVVYLLIWFLEITCETALMYSSTLQ